jgi:hypothetical protein
MRFGNGPAWLDTKGCGESGVGIDSRALPTPLNLADFRLPDSRPIRQLLLSPPVCAALLDQGIDQPILELQSTEVSDAGWSFLLGLSLDIRKEIVEIALGLTSSHATNDMAFKPYPQVVC